MIDITLPNFLNRRLHPQPLPRKTRKHRRKIVRPDGDLWVNASKWDIYFHDEATSIGCGRRFVWIVEGRKWVRLQDYEGNRAKIAMATWRVLKACGAQVLT